MLLLLLETCVERSAFAFHSAAARARLQEFAFLSAHGGGERTRASSVAFPIYIRSRKRAQGPGWIICPAGYLVHSPPRSVLIKISVLEFCVIFTACGSAHSR